MAGFLLDTNVLSEFKRRDGPDPRVTAWLRATSPDLLWASVLSFGEIREGIERLAPGKRRDELQQWLDRDLDQWFEQRILPVTRLIAERWGILDRSRVWQRNAAFRTSTALSPQPRWNMISPWSRATLKISQG